MTEMKHETDIATSIHEASHAVIDRVLTLVCGGATIKPDGDSAGHSICYDPWACIYAWEKRGKVREPDAVWHARIIGFRPVPRLKQNYLARNRSATAVTDTRSI